MVLTYEIWCIKWNIDFPTFYCAYLWWNCWEIWRTNLINSLLWPFECPYLWRNYPTTFRTSIINILLWIKLFWNKYVPFKTSTDPLKKPFYIILFISLSKHSIICHLQTWLTIVFSNIFTYVTFYLDLY